MSTKKECLTFWKNVLQAEPDVCGRRHPYDQETLIHKLVRLDKRKSLKAFVRGLFFTPTQIVGLREIGRKWKDKVNMMSVQKENADPWTGNGAMKKTKTIDGKQRKNEEFTLHVSLNRVAAVDSVKLSSLEKSMDTDSIQNEASSINASIEDSNWKVQIEGYKKFRAMIILVSKSGDSEAMSQLVRACSSFPSKIVKSTSSGAIRATAVLEACACISAFVELGQPKVDKTTFENLLQLCMVKDKAVVWKAAVATVETVIEFAAPNSCDTMARLLLQHLMSPKDSKNKKKTKKKGKRNNMTSHARCLWIQFITSALRHWNEDWDGKKWCNVPVPLGSTPLSLESIATKTVQDTGKNIRKKMIELVSTIQPKFPHLASRIMRSAPSNFKLKNESSKTPSEPSRSKTRSTTGRKKAVTTTSRKRARAHSDGVMASSTKSNKKRKSERKPLRRCQSDGDMKKKKNQQSVVDFGTCDMSRQEMNKALGSMPKLFDKSAPPTWKTRMAKLKLLAQIVNTLCQGGDAPAKERSAVQQQLSQLHIIFGLCKQVRDLRSAVVKVACRVVATIAKCLGRYFDPFSGKIMSTLVPLTVTPHPLVVRKSASSALDMILECTEKGLSYALPKILSICTTKSNPKLRCRATDILLTVLKIWDVSVLQDNSLVATVAHTISDALPETRERGRQCLEVLTTRMPDSASKILESLSPRTRRTIKRDSNASTVSEISAQNLDAELASAENEEEDELDLEVQALEAELAAARAEEELLAKEEEIEKEAEMDEEDEIDEELKTLEAELAAAKAEEARYTMEGMDLEKMKEDVQEDEEGGVEKEEEVVDAMNLEEELAAVVEEKKEVV
eukprot:g2735.t1